MRRKKGEGSITYDKARKNYIACVRDHLGKRIQKRLPTKEKATEWILKTKVQIIDGSYYVNDITLYEWCIKVLALKKKTIKPQTIKLYKTAIKQLKPFWNRKIKDIKAIELEQFIIDNDTSQSAYSTIKTIFSMAVEYELINKNPVKNYKKVIENKKTKVFTIEQSEKIVQYLKTYPKDYLLFLTLLNTGMRIGELLALTFEDIDVKDSTIKINKTLQLNMRTVSTPKTKTSNRIIKIPPQLNNEFKKLIGLQTNINYLKNLVFPNSQGKYRRYWQVDYTFKKLLKAVEIEGHYSIHVFRHTHASQLLNLGIPITDISKRLGHSCPTVTLSIYSHVVTHKEDNIIKQLENNKAFGW